MGVFTYSHEEDTSAFLLRDSVSESVKQERARELMDIQENISFELNSHKVGQTLKVLVDREEGDYYVGRSEHDSPEVDNEVLIAKTGSLVAPGSFCYVKITKAESFDLFGELT